jgi:hypothetical protein
MCIYTYIIYKTYKHLENRSFLQNACLINLSGHLLVVFRLYDDLKFSSVCSQRKLSLQLQIVYTYYGSAQKHDHWESMGNHRNP